MKILRCPRTSQKWTAITDQKVSCMHWRTLIPRSGYVFSGTLACVKNKTVKRHSVDGGRLRKRVSVARFAAIYPVGPVVVAPHFRRMPLLLHDTG